MIDAAKPDADSTSVDGLRRRVADRLSQDPRVKRIELDTVDPAVINLKTASGWDKRVDVSNLAGRLKHFAPADHSDAINAFATASLERPDAGSRDIYPTFRPSSIIDLAMDMIQQNGFPQSAMVPYETISDELVILYQLLGDGSLSAVSWSDLDTADLSELREKAVGNVERLLPSLSVHEIVEGVVSCSIDGLDYLSSGLLLSNGFWKVVTERFPGGAYIGIPTRESVVLIDRSRSGALEVARSTIEILRQDAVDLVSSEVYERIGTQFRAVSN